jgi:hypothetical protein
MMRDEMTSDPRSDPRRDVDAISSDAESLQPPAFHFDDGLTSLFY